MKPDKVDAGWTKKPSQEASNDDQVTINNPQESSPPSLRRKQRSVRKPERRVMKQETSENATEETLPRVHNRPGTKV